MEKNIIDYLSELSKINLNEEEKKTYSLQMNEIFKWIEQLNELKLNDNHNIYEIKEKTPLRKDEEKIFLNREAIINNFTDKEFDFLKVKKVMDN